MGKWVHNESSCWIIFKWKDTELLFRMLANTGKLYKNNSRRGSYFSVVSFIYISKASVLFHCTSIWRKSPGILLSLVLTKFKRQMSLWNTMCLQITDLEMPVKILMGKPFFVEKVLLHLKSVCLNQDYKLISQIVLI